MSGDQHAHERGRGQRMRAGRISIESRSVKSLPSSAVMQALRVRSMLVLCLISIPECCRAPYPYEVTGRGPRGLHFRRGLVHRPSSACRKLAELPARRRAPLISHAAGVPSQQRAATKSPPSQRRSGEPLWGHACGLVQSAASLLARLLAEARGQKMLELHCIWLTCLRWRNAHAARPVAWSRVRST